MTPGSVGHLDYIAIRHLVRTATKAGIPKTVTTTEGVPSSSYFAIVDRPTLDVLEPLTRGQGYEEVFSFVSATRYQFPSVYPNEVGAVHELRVLLTPDSQQVSNEVHKITIVDPNTYTPLLSMLFQVPNNLSMELPEGVSLDHIKAIVEYAAPIHNGSTKTAQLLLKDLESGLFKTIWDFAESENIDKTSGSWYTQTARIYFQRNPK